MVGEGRDMDVDLDSEGWYGRTVRTRDGTVVGIVVACSRMARLRDGCGCMAPTP